MTQESKGKTWRQRLAPWWDWFLRTSTLVGIPIVMLLFMVGGQKLFFTATCQVAGMSCEYALGSTSAMAEYMGDLLAANPDVDFVTKPKRK